MELPLRAALSLPADWDVGSPANHEMPVEPVFVDTGALPSNLPKLDGALEDPDAGDDEGEWDTVDLATAGLDYGGSIDGPAAELIDPFGSQVVDAALTRDLSPTTHPDEAAALLSDLRRDRATPASPSRPSSTAALSPPPQDSFHFSLGTRLGSNGESTLFMATDTHDGRPVAIREMTAEAALRANARARFNAEARINQTLDHPNLVHVYGYGEIEGRPYLARELVDGMNLRAVLALSGNAPLSVPSVLGLGTEIAAALAYAHHACGSDGEPLHLVHGEVSASAILVTPEGVAKLTEVGVSVLDGRFLRPTGGGRRGQFGYRAPEQLQGRSSGPLVDVFALGLVLVELLSGLTLVLDGTLELSTLADDVRARCALRSDLPADLVGLLTEMTALSPLDRPPGARVVADRLSAILATLDEEPDLEAELRPIFDRVAPLRGRTRGPPSSDRVVEVSDDAVESVVDVGAEPLASSTPQALVQPITTVVEPALAPDAVFSPERQMQQLMPGRAADDGVYLLIDRKTMPPGPRGSSSPGYFGPHSSTPPPYGPHSSAPPGYVQQPSAPPYPWYPGAPYVQSTVPGYPVAVPTQPPYGSTYPGSPTLPPNNKLESEPPPVIRTGPSLWLVLLWMTFGAALAWLGVFLQTTTR